MIIQQCGWNLTCQRIFSYCSCDSFTAGSQVLNAWCECFDFFSKQEESFALCYEVVSKTAKISGNGQLRSIITGTPHFTVPLRTHLFYRAKNQFGGSVPVAYVSFSQCQRPQ